jgi:pSer/pThr/pTyr-binding forkhead associated (FHA) protein
VLTDPSIVIGAGDAAQIRLKSQSVSKAHALMLVEDGKAYVRDLASRTQLFVNDAPVREAFLGEGDVVRVGRFGFGVHENAAAQGRPHDRTAPVVRLRMNDTGMERVPWGRVILIGRRHGCDVLVPDRTLSGAHAVLFYVGGQWWVRDLGSRAGTLVNGAEVRQQRALSAGDVLKLGAAEVLFVGEAVAEPTVRVDSRPWEDAELAAGPVDVAAALESLSVSGRGEAEDVSEAEAAGAPVTSEQPEAETTPAQVVESGMTVEEAREPLAPPEAPVEEPAPQSMPEVPAAEPMPPAIPPGGDVKRPSVFANAPIERTAVEAPLPPPQTPPLPPAPLPLPPPPQAAARPSPPPAEVSPVPAPGASTWEDRSATGGESGGERVPSVYRSGDGVDHEDGSGDEDRADSVDDDDEAQGEGSSGRLEIQRPATDKEWDEAVTVWSFAELAQRGRERSSRDEARAEPVAAARSSWSDRRRWLWVTVGAAIACVAVLVTLLAHKLW